MPGMRAFLALDLPEEVREQLAGLQRTLSSTLPPVHWVRPDLMHVTLKFFGQMDPAMPDRLLEALQEIGSLHGPMTFTVQGLGVFPHPANPRVLWAGLTGPLEALHELIDHIGILIDPLGFPPDSSPFRPHLTLARIKSGGRAVGAELQRGRYLQTREPIGSFRVDRMVLYQSELWPSGPCYQALWEIPFLGAAEDPKRGGD
jgi:RNA 2',3'-cyclic 3'-phosphodiesterase